MSTRPSRLGKYELRERLGHGGMAEVWKAYDTQLQRFVAIKILHPDLRADPQFMTRFVREAQLIASLRHHNIVQIHDFRTAFISPESKHKTAFMVMDYIEGQTLSDYIHITSHKGIFPSAAEILHLFKPISEAIDYAHRNGMIHRDIKPANILLDKRASRDISNSRHFIGDPILSDFGIAKLLGTSASTLTGGVIGTPLYISPEQAQGKPGDERSDIYSLGVILYEVLTGTLPFTGNNPLDIIRQHVQVLPIPPRLINPDITPAVAAVIMRSLAKNPAARFASAATMITALEDALEISLDEDSAAHIYEAGAMNEPTYVKPLQQEPGDEVAFPYSRPGRYTASLPSSRAYSPNVAASLWKSYRGLIITFATAIAILLTLIFTGSSILSWGTAKYNDIVYGYPRFFQTDAIVGHGDSPEHPSHFIALNLRGQVIVIELPAGNPTKSRIYVGPDLNASGDDQIPLTLSFSDVNHDGKPDMIIHIQDRQVVFCNDGTKFTPCSTS